MKRILVLALCALPFAASAQEDDRSYLTALLEDNLSGAGRKITITGFTGALSSQATIAELSIADDDGIWLTLRDVVLDWNRSALFAGRVSVNTLSAEEIILARLPSAGESETALPSPEATPFALPELPVSVNIGQVAAKRIELGESVLGQPVEATLNAALSLSGGEGEAKLDLVRTGTGPAGKIVLDAAYTNSSKVLKIDLQAAEGAEGIAASLMGLPGTPAVELTVKGEAPLTDYTADLTLASDGAERLAGQVSVAMAEGGGTKFGADLDGDLAPLFLPDYAEFFGNSVQLKAEGEKTAAGVLDLDSFQLVTRAMELGGSLQLAADGLPQRFDVTGQLGLDGQPVLLPLTTDQRTSITHADLALKFDATAGDRWTADVTMTGLDRDDFKAANARISGGGTIARPDGKPLAEGLLDIVTDGLAPTDAALAKALGDRLTGQVGFRWQQGQDNLDLPVLRLNGSDYAFDGGLKITGLEAGLTIGGQGNLRATDLARFADLAGQPALAGQVNATLSGQTALLTGAFDASGKIEGQGLRIGVAEVDNLLSGPSTIDLVARRDETGTRLERLDLQAASLTAKASGTIATAGSDITADLDFADLSVLGPNYRGSMKGRAQVTGTPDAGSATLDATGDGLAMGVAEVDNLLRGPSTIVAAANFAGSTVDLQKLEVNAASLAVNASGKIAAAGHDLTANLNFRDLRALGGSYRGNLSAQAAFKGTPENGTLTASATGSGLAIGQPEADRLLAGESRLAADLALTDGRIKINKATLANPQLRAEASGAINGTHRQVDLQAELTNLALLVPEFPGRFTVSGSAVDDGQGYDLNLAVRGPGGIDTTVRGRVAANFGSANLAIAGGAEAGLANAFLRPTTVSGGLRYDLRLNGPLAPASLGGAITLQGLRIAHPSSPASIDGLGGTINLAGGRANLNLNGSISSGGSFTVSGGAGLAAPFAGDLNIALNQVQLRDPQLFQTRLNGRVTVNGPLAGGALIGGDIVLNETELKIPSTSFGAAQGLDELKHVGEPADVRATRARAGLLDDGSGGGSGGTSVAYPLDLRISAPQRIFVRGRGLDLEMGGELRVSGTTANVVPSGAFDLVRGRLDILGKRLNITQATLQLQGDFDPYLLVLASNESDGITSSVKIEGMASEPKVSFVSSPELPEEEVLARLLFGRDLTSLSAFQAAQLASAVATLAGKGGDGIVGKLRKGFGLDDLDISTNAEGETELKAGKYISQNAYTEVQVDGDGQAKINLNLDLNDSITLRGSVGADGGTSIGIFKEKDY
ncbi:translocation/assembly module TamB domain-containing protein [Gemmobacter serpentinus]|uniref:translocation/assembly module TamB domain-containing protein n=1 Tax=Gemmobacter serpentinus TaxID=2652247 RepID=UPI00124C9CDA|nr:translocation/assembly module TamB domain-containing protein [Gemmobacter serpentinus]